MHPYLSAAERRGLHVDHSHFHCLDLRVDRCPSVSIFFTVYFADQNIRPVLSSKDLRNLSNRILLAVTLLMYASSTVIWASGLKIMWNELHTFLPGLLSPSSQAGEGIGLTLVLLLSDGVVLWRACVVWGWSKSVVSIATSLLVSLLGLNVAYTLSSIPSTFASPPQSLLGLASSQYPLAVSLYTVSTFANVCATGMVAYKAWNHRQDIRRYLKNRTAKSAVENVLSLLVESSVVYSIFTILLLLTMIPTLSPLYFAFQTYWASAMNQISGIYPTLIVIIVALQKSHLEHQFSYVNRVQDVLHNALPFSIRIPQTQSRTSASGGVSMIGTHVASQRLPDSQSGSSLDAFSPPEKEHLGSKGMPGNTPQSLLP
ncbi:hypothetical protein OF83DRAFT_1153063 [Amylostereum chailletii]|nr:hypothetical protein OF83DRAFT_1153063 [Amylostereum chailletii]